MSVRNLTRVFRRETGRHPQGLRPAGEAPGGAGPAAAAADLKVEAVAVAAAASRTRGSSGGCGGTAYGTSVSHGGATRRGVTEDDRMQKVASGRDPGDADGAAAAVGAADAAPRLRGPATWRSSSTRAWRSWTSRAPRRSSPRPPAARAWSGRPAFRALHRGGSTKDPDREPGLRAGHSRVLDRRRAEAGHRRPPGRRHRRGSLDEPEVHGLGGARPCGRRRSR